MQVVLRTDRGERGLDVELRTPEATLGDLVRAAGERCDGTVLVGGRRLPAGCPVTESGLLDGGTLTVGGGAFVPPPRTGAAVEVAVTAGLDAGGTWPLDGDVGGVVVGRAPGAGVRLDHPAVSRAHCAIASGACGLQVTDLEARNAVGVDRRVLRRGETVVVPGHATVRLGPLELRVRVRPDDRPTGVPRQAAGPGGTVPLDRPPRPFPPAPPEPLELPREPGERGREPFGVAALVGPLVLAAVLVAVTGDARFALFSALTPVLAVGTWWESRRRAARGTRRDAARWAADLRDLEEAVARAAEHERDRRRELAPDPAEVLRRAAAPSTRLWERRTGDPDVLQLGAGTADEPWRPPARGVPGAPLPAEVDAVLDGGVLVASPVLVDLSPGGVVGLVGDRVATLAVARSLLCGAAVTSGPADLTVGVFVDAGRQADWEWCRWLPHTRADTAGVRRWLSADRDTSDALLGVLAGALRGEVPGLGAGTLLLVLDSAGLTSGRGAAARDLLAAARRPPPAGTTGPTGPQVAGLVLAPTQDALPAACDQVLRVRAEGSASLHRLRTGERVDGVLAAGLSRARAERCARDLARFEDPERTGADAGLPAQVRLLPLLELDVGPDGGLDPDGVRRRWRAGGRDPGARVPLGVTDRGLFVLDLVRDGAHGLVGGTTGSGKSELLRSLVAGLAASADAAHLTFVLVDYKGGAAFDVCARLPHVVGLVTDLDEQLGERALRALEAELHARERTLRAAGVDDLPGYLALGLPEPLPRLVVVIDEFATMAQELPGFVSSLVGIAQRGRTLGVHLLLATQRPSGAVNDDIRANTNLRVALRVQDAADSTDVLGVPAAAQIGRDRPGRAYVRLGPGEVVPIQTALVTCVSRPGAEAPVDVAPCAFGPRRAPAAAAAPVSADPPALRTDLERLVDAVLAAHAAEGLAAPRRPWPEPLPARAELAALPSPVDAHPDLALVALADDPAAQAQHAAGWDLRTGGLLLLGVPGSGTTTALVTLAVALAQRRSPRELEVYALDAGAGGLSVLEALPHTGAVVAAADRERTGRLLRRLAAELARRRGLPRAAAAAAPRTVLLVDGLAALRAAYDDVEGLELLDLLARLHADGPEVGLSVAVTADRPGAVPAAVAAVTTQRWVFRLADPGDLASLGVPRGSAPPAVPGRAVLMPSGLQAQVARAAPQAWAEAAARWSATPAGATAVEVLPGRVAPERAAVLREGVWEVPVGVAESDLSVAVLPLHDGDGALVAGPARSGRSSVLAALAVALAAAGVEVVVSGGRRSPLVGGTAGRWVPAGELPELARELAGRGPDGPLALLVDDADAVDDPDGVLEALVAGAPPHLRVLAAGRSDALRGAYGHWTARLRRSRTGLLLRPQVDLDGDLLGVVLPRRAPVPLSLARGYLVADGEARLVQAATLAVAAGSRRLG